MSSWYTRRVASVVGESSMSMRTKIPLRVGALQHGGDVVAAEGVVDVEPHLGGLERDVGRERVRGNRLENLVVGGHGGGGVRALGDALAEHVYGGAAPLLGQPLHRGDGVLQRGPGHVAACKEVHHGSRGDRQGCAHQRVEHAHGILPGRGVLAMVRMWTSRGTRALQGAGARGSRGAGGQHVVHEHDVARHRAAHGKRRGREAQAVAAGAADLGAAAASAQGVLDRNAQLARERARREARPGCTRAAGA